MFRGTSCLIIQGQSLLRMQSCIYRQAARKVLRPMVGGEEIRVQWRSIGTVKWNFKSKLMALHRVQNSSIAWRIWNCLKMQAACSCEMLVSAYNNNTWSMNLEDCIPQIHSHCALLRVINVHRSLILISGHVTNSSAPSLGVQLGYSWHGPLLVLSWLYIARHMSSWLNFPFLQW